MRNRKAKKLIAILVMLMLSVTTLAGCSVTDAAYTALFMEASSIENYSFEGEFTLEMPDPNSPRDYRYSMFSGFSSRRGDMITISMNISGACIQAEDGEFYLDCTIKFGINDRRMPHSFSLLIVDDEIYIPVQDCISAIILYYKHVEGYSDKMCSSLKAALEKELTGNDYVVIRGIAEALDDVTYMMHSGVMMSNSAALAGNQNGELSKIFIDAFLKMFSGLGSGMTRMDGNGVTLEITPERAMTFLGNLTKYMQSNKRTIYREALNLLSAIEETYRDGDRMKEFYRMARFELEDDEQGFYDAIDEIAFEFAGMNDFEKDLLLLTFRGSHLRHTISKSGNTYRDRIDANLTYMGEQYFSLKGQSTKAGTSVNKKAVNAENPIDMEDISDAIGRVYNTVNPAREIEISWWGDDDSGWAWGTVRRVEGRSWTSFRTIMQGEELYLPMRELCEWFDEEVGWDNTAKQAYVVRGGEQIEMDGRLEYTTLFVKIRDFEKLGYTVDYEYDKGWGEHIVTIKK